MNERPKTDRYSGCFSDRIPFQFAANEKSSITDKHDGLNYGVSSLKHNFDHMVPATLSRERKRIKGDKLGMWAKLANISISQLEPERNKNAD